MADCNVTSALGFLGPLGWQELVILACPLFMVGLVLLILFLTGVLGGKKDK